MFKMFSRAALAAAILIICIATAAGCSSGIFDTALSDYGYTKTFVDNRESVTEGYFKFTINTSKNEFAEGEQIDCWAQLEYIGDEDSITVYSDGDPITMEISGNSLGSSGSRRELVLEKGKPLRVDLSDSVPESGALKPGKHQIDAYVYIGLTPDMMISYDAFVSAAIEVVE